MKMLPKEQDEYCDKALQTTKCCQINNYNYKKTPEI